MPKLTLRLYFGYFRPVLVKHTPFAQQYSLYIARVRTIRCVCVCGAYVVPTIIAWFRFTEEKPGAFYIYKPLAN